MRTVARYETPEQAHLAKIRLGFHGLDSFLQDEYLVQIDWLYSNAVGGVRLQVGDEDVDEALEILKVPLEESDESSYPVCPNCESGNTHLDGVPKRLACFFMVFISAPIICLGRKMVCRDCGHSWDPNQQNRFPWVVFRFIGGKLFILGAVVFLFGYVPMISRVIANQRVLHYEYGSFIHAWMEFHKPGLYPNIPPGWMIPGMALMALGGWIWNRGTAC